MAAIIVMYVKLYIKTYIHSTKKKPLHTQTLSDTKPAKPSDILNTQNP